MLRTHLLGSGAYIFPGMVSAIDQCSDHRHSSIDGSKDLRLVTGNFQLTGNFLKAVLSLAGNHLICHLGHEGLF